MEARVKSQGMAKLATGALLVAALAALVPVRATGTCVLTGPNGEYRVGKMDTAGYVGLYTEFSDPLTLPPTDDSNYSSSTGVFFINATTRQIAGVVRFFSSPTPHAVVRVPGVVDQSTWFPSSWPSITSHGGSAGGDFGRLSFYVPRGTYFVVGYGWGTVDGVHPFGSQQWEVEALTGATCPLISQSGDGLGDLLNFDQADFGGGTHVYAPLVGAGSGLSLTRVTARNTVVGMMYAEASASWTIHCPSLAVDILRKVGAPADLRFYKDGVFQYRVGPKATCENLREVATSAGTLRFDADYYGIDPLIVINLLEIDLPYL